MLRQRCTCCAHFLMLILVVHLTDSTMPAIDAEAKGRIANGRAIHVGAAPQPAIFADASLQQRKVVDPKQASSAFVLARGPHTTATAETNSASSHDVSRVQTVLSTPRSVLPPPRSNPPSAHQERRWATAHEEATAQEDLRSVAQNGNADGGLSLFDIRVSRSE